MTQNPGDHQAKRLRIAMIGMRGLPADLPKAGGGERETEAKAVRMAERGHEVTVYCRWHYNRHPVTPYQGVNLISLPSIPTKNLDTPSHTLLATLHVIFRNTADIISYHGMGNALFLPFAKLGRKKTVVYMDGVDWERPKWGKLAQTMLKVAARFAFRWADVVYVDNHASADAFKRELERKPLIITLGADIWPPPGNSLLTQFGLEPENYILFVGLLQPDKGVHLLVEAYKMIDTSLPLVIVGDNLNEQLYVKNLKQKADGRVRFLGFVYAQAARQLFANCYIYVQPSIMEGNSPALMSAMACGRCVVVNGIEQNLETIGEAGTAFYPNDVTDLSRTLTRLLNDQEEVQLLGRKARERIEKDYNWEVVVDKLEHEFMQLEG